MPIEVTFWGVRGSIACPATEYMKYGGNTSCIEVSAGGHTLILDAGTGLRGLGNALAARGQTKATFLLTHTHWDHINGFPFFGPAYDPKAEFTVMAGHLNGRPETIRDVLSIQMTGPLFPVPLEALKARFTFADFVAGDSFDLAGNIHVRTVALNHPNGATAYRIEHGGNSVCYITDTEHVPGQPDPNVLSIMRDADLAIYDATFTDAEFQQHLGWGHSSWQEGIRLAQAANVRRLAIFHHNPDHDDAAMAAIEDEARRMWSGAFVSREGMTLSLV